MTVELVTVSTPHAPVSSRACAVHLRVPQVSHTCAGTLFFFFFGGLFGQAATETERPEL